MCFNDFIWRYYYKKLNFNKKKSNPMIRDKLKKGYLLIAEPTIIGDVSFNRSVILLADYNEEGSIGFIIKPIDPSSL